MSKYLTLLFVPLFLFANIGKITVSNGEVTIKRGASTVKGTSGYTLEKNDFISTGNDGKVQIVFSDKTIFTIGKNSTLDIAEYLYDENQPSSNKAQFNVLKGAFSSITGRIGKLNRSKFELKTKSASIGIRGTIVVANQETVMCTEGAISVTTLSGDTVRVEAGFKTSILNDVPSAPDTIKDGDVEDMGLDSTKEESEEDEQEAEGTEDEVTENVNNELANNNISNSTKVIKVSLLGKTIDSSGNQQNMTISGASLSNTIDLESESLITKDDSGETTEATLDDTVLWGEWAEDPNKKWVAGKETSTEILDNMRNDSSQTINGTYTGKVLGTVNGNDDIKMDSTNNVNINVELGGGQNNVNGDIDFQTQSGQSWDTSFSGTTSDSTFQATSLSGTVTNTDTTTDTLTTGAVNGQFYGDNAEAVGGTFLLKTDSDTATGVFKATK